MVESGANVNAQTKYDETPLMNASQYTCLGIVQYLVENGAQIDKMDYEGKTALTFFSESKRESEQKEQIQIIEFLI